MTQQEKQLLLRELCARLPYGVICRYETVIPLLGDVLNYGPLQEIRRKGEYFTINGADCSYEDIKPYLRAMSSMTEEEFHNSPIYGNDVTHSYKIDKDGFHFIRIETYDNEVLDWLNEHHFDFHCLIEKGLALEAPVDMYKND